MNLIDANSMVKTLDHFNEKLLFGETVPTREGIELAQWIATRLGEKGSYRGMFAPTAVDFQQGIHLFTGEKLVSASARHIMGQEAARAVWLLGKQDPAMREVYRKATLWMQDNPEFSQYGTFCCGRCTMAYWRHVWVGDFDHKSAFITRGLQSMQRRRSGNGQWRTIPFFYAIYTLLDLDLAPARAELEYARPVMERYLRREHPGQYARRKRVILEKAMEIVA